MVFRCYSDINEKICWTLHPLKSPVEDFTRENLGKTPWLAIFATDYEKLLLDYVEEIYPLRPPYPPNSANEQIQMCFDETGENWIGKGDWGKIIAKIREKLRRNNNRPSKLEREFYNNFLEWVERELEWADIIVVDSNL
ncbi:MAG: hypothetical protein FWG68_00515 [Defluviitaleaceae bacterium]|nr:hypothetical protein [Defluviitaleaceae bacterium]